MHENKSMRKAFCFLETQALEVDLVANKGAAAIRYVCKEPLAEDMFDDSFNVCGRPQGSRPTWIDGFAIDQATGVVLYPIFLNVKREALN